MFDNINFSLEKYKTWPDKSKKDLKLSRANIIDTTDEFEILMPINFSIFNSTNLLPSNTSIDLSFERLKAFSSCVHTGDAEVAHAPMELKKCFLLAPYKKDENMFNLERNAIQRPIKVKYDDYTIKRFNVPRGTTNVVMSDLTSGALPL